MEVNTNLTIERDIPETAFQKNPEAAPSHISHTNENSILNESSNPFEENFEMNNSSNRKYGLLEELFGIFHFLENKVNLRNRIVKIPEKSIVRQLNNIVEIISELKFELTGVQEELSIPIKKTPKKTMINSPKGSKKSDEIVEILLEKLTGDQMKIKLDTAVSLAKEEIEKNLTEKMVLLENKLLERIGFENRNLLVKVEEIVDEVEDSIREEYELGEERSEGKRPKEKRVTEEKSPNRPLEEEIEEFKLENLTIDIKNAFVPEFPISKTGICFVQYGKTDNEILVSRNKPTKTIAYYKEGKLQFESPDISCKDILHIKDKFWIYDDDKKQLLIQEKEDEDPIPFCSVDIFGYGRDFGNILTSMLKEELIVIRYHKKLHFIQINKNLDKGIEKKIKIKDPLDEYKSVKVFGKNNDKMLVITDRGRLILNEVTIKGKEIRVTKLDEIKISNKSEFGYRVAVSENGEYAFVVMGKGGDFDNKCSSITALKIFRERRLEQLSLLEIDVLDDHNFACFEVYGIFREKIVITAGLGCCSTTLRTFVFDVKKNEFRYLSSLTRDLTPTQCYKLLHSGDGKLCGLTNDSIIMKIDYDFLSDI